MRCVSVGFALLVLGFVSSSRAQAAPDYDPLAVSKSQDPVAPIDWTITDRRRERQIPLRIYLPDQSEPAPVVLFSHGLGGSRRGCGYLGRHWSARGYAVVFVQHPGSDEDVWKGVPLRQRLTTLKQAASIRNTLDRYRDIPAVLDHLQQQNGGADERFAGRLDLTRVGMSGHSYGAITTQGVSGQSAPGIGARFADRRIDAAVLFSPNRPQRFAATRAFGDVTIPWLLMTGSQDTSPINDTTVEDRRAVYPALPKTIDKYELVLAGAEHHAFTDGRRLGATRDPNHHRVILALSTAFWDSYLKEDSAAKEWLRGESPKKLMQPKDQWQHSLGEAAAKRPVPTESAEPRE